LLKQSKIIDNKPTINAVPDFPAQRFCVGGSVPDGVCHCTLRFAERIASEDLKRAIWELVRGVGKSEFNHLNGMC
jgi:hypothetical protein